MDMLYFNNVGRLSSSRSSVQARPTHAPQALAPHTPPGHDAPHTRPLPHAPLTHTAHNTGRGPSCRAAAALGRRAPPPTPRTRSREVTRGHARGQRGHACVRASGDPRHSRRGDPFLEWLRPAPRVPQVPPATSCVDRRRDAQQFGDGALDG
eukprot:6653608-Prymnesium_polylepis.1